MEKGNERAVLALEIYIHRRNKYLLSLVLNNETANSSQITQTICLLYR